MSTEHPFDFIVFCYYRRRLIVFQLAISLVGCQMRQPHQRITRKHRSWHMVTWSDVSCRVLLFEEFCPRFFSCASLEIRLVFCLSHTQSDLSSLRRNYHLCQPCAWFLHQSRMFQTSETEQRRLTCHKQFVQILTELTNT